VEVVEAEDGLEEPFDEGFWRHRATLTRCV
jgi:hypothetical protein